MRSVIVPFGSFMFGVLCASVFGFGASHTSTVEHLVFAQAKSSTTPPTRSPNAGLIVIGTGSVPSVPPLDTTPEVGDTFSKMGPVRLDSLNCVRCNLSELEFTYGGGLFQCADCKLSNVRLLNLDGAALNTFRTLQTFGVIPSPTPSEQTHPNRPNVITISRHNEGVVTLVNFDQK